MQIFALWPSSHASWLGRVAWLTSGCCSVAGYNASLWSMCHVPCLDLHRFCLLCSMECTKVVWQTKAVQWFLSSFNVMLVRHELGAFCTMLYFLDPGGHEFGSHHRLYGLVQAPWITIRHPQGIKDHQTHLNTIKQTIKQHQQQRPWKEQCQRKAKHCEYVWYRDLFKN